MWRHTYTYQVYDTYYKCHLNYALKLIKLEYWADRLNEPLPKSSKNTVGKNNVKVFISLKMY